MDGFRLSADSQSLVFGNPALGSWETQRRLTQETQPSQPLLAPLPARQSAGRGSSEELLQSIRHKEVLAAVEALRIDLREESKWRAEMATRLDRLEMAVYRIEGLLSGRDRAGEAAAEDSALTDSFSDGLSEPMTVVEYLRRRAGAEVQTSHRPCLSPADLLFS